MPNPMHAPRYAVLRRLLVEIREEQTLTQVDVSQRLGKPQSYVSKYERGERRIDIIEFIDIANALGIKPVDAMKRLSRKLSD